MRTTLLIVLLMTCPMIAAPAAAAPESAPASVLEGGETAVDGPLCWRIDPTSIPPLHVWFC